MPRKHLLCIVSLLASLASCGFGDKPYDQVDPASVPATPTYNHEIAPRMDYFCTGCHSEDATLGVNATSDFSTIQSVCQSIPVITDAAFVERSMPPGGAERMAARDGAILLKWLEVGCPQCNEDRDCANGRRCVTKPGTDPLPPVRLCACLDSADCPNQMCNTTSGLCVNCVTSTDCAGTNKCNANGNCVQCIADGDCTDAGKTKCNVSAFRCVQCLGDTDCTAPETCNTSTNTCEAP